MLTSCDGRCRAGHGDESRRGRYDRSDRYESGRYDGGSRYYRLRRCDPPPPVVDDLGDGHHYREHHVSYEVLYGRVYRHHYHHVHHYRDHRDDDYGYDD